VFRLKVSVIGLGYVGLPLSSLLARKYEVIGFEVEKNKAAVIARGQVPIDEPGLHDILSEALKSQRLNITSNPARLRETSVKVITVGTPYDEKADFVDYGQLESALDIIIPNLNIGDVVILKSTVPPGTTMGLVKNKIEASGFKVPEEIGVVFSPERMVEGQAVKDFQVLPKIIGASDERSGSIAEKVIGSLGGKIIRVSNPETAETIKMVDNYSRYVFLGLTNELALICEKIGVDVLEVIKSAKDNYPRNSGLLLPGPGVGGSCLNKDPFILRGILRKSGEELEMVKSAQSVNSHIPFHLADLISRFRPKGQVTLLGVAFKGDTDDTRFAPSLIIKDELVKRNYRVRMTDPYVVGDGIVKDLYGTCTGSNIIVILTDHSCYNDIDLQKLKSLAAESPMILDTRGMVDRAKAVEAGFEYHGLGRL
jgi:UDP-N-acetyl-D-mannosaminuronic acid dehydrogenase